MGTQDRRACGRPHRQLIDEGEVEFVEQFAHPPAHQTDVVPTGKLCDVHPDGRAILLTDGILRARYRESLSAPQPLTPDRPYELVIDLGATANVFRAGHRIRLDVSSSNFPRFDRNTNSGNVIAHDDADMLRTATNRVYHDTAHPSRLILPVLRPVLTAPRAEAPADVNQPDRRGR